MGRLLQTYLIFFFNDTATTEIYTLSLHDALPISQQADVVGGRALPPTEDRHDEGEPDHHLGGGHHQCEEHEDLATEDRKSTRLNSRHANISYAVFCLKKKNMIIMVRSVIPITLIL